MTTNAFGAKLPGLSPQACEPAARPRRRWRLWDIHTGIHGALFALSFSADELHRLVRRAGIESPAGARYYDIHRHLCEACASRNTLSELVEKTLDQKFAAKVFELRGTVTGEALERRWREAWSKGRGLLALFWAFLSHPCATDEIRAAFYADVHALFFNALSEREGLLGKVEALEHRCRTLERRRREEVQVLQRRLGETSHPKPAGAKGASETEQIAALRLQLDSALQRAASAQARVRTLEDRLKHGRPAAPGTPPKGGLAERPAAPPMLPKTSENDAKSSGGTVEIVTRIPGVCIAYVGGRPGSVERIRDFCEKRGALFIGHDGGIEEAPARLDELLERADVVFYPVDCISHEGALHLKAHCRRTRKPSIPLRNASVSAFCRGMKSWCGLT